MQRSRAYIKSFTSTALTSDVVWALSVIFVSAYSLTAQQATTSTPDGWLNRATLTGNWGGTRTTLDDAGIHLRSELITESAANPIGGRRQSARYTQQVDFGADLNLGRLVGDPGATFEITFNDRLGRSLSNDAIGNLFAVQQLYGSGQNFRLVELNYQQSLLANKLNFQLGWSPVGDEFASLPIFCYFQNGFICGHPSPMSTNSGAQNYPIGQWGASVKVNPTPEFYAQTGAYQVNPDKANSDRGLDLSVHSTGVLVPVEFGWLPSARTGKFPGIYKLGGYYNSSDSPDVLQDINGLSAGLTGAPFMMHRGRFGAYGMGDQVIERDGSNSHHFLRVGAIGGMADRATAPYEYFVAGGGVRQGTFRHRDTDFISVFFGYARINPRLTRYQEDRNVVAAGSIAIQTYESIAEIDYNIQITPWLSFRPNLQYVINPGGTGRIPNAFVVGLNTSVTF